MAKKIDYSKILRGGDNKPTNPDLWEKAKSAAKAKFDVYPSAVANAWASRYYAEKGGDWKKMADGGEVTITPEDLTLRKRPLREQPFLTSLEETMPRRKGPAPQQEKQQGKQQKATEEKQETDKSTMAGVDATPEELLAGGPIEREAEVVDIGDEFRDLADKGVFAEGGMVGPLAALTTAVEGEKDSLIPQMSMFPAAENPPSAKLKEPAKMAKGGYVVTRSNERKGKTHKVTGPDGSVKFFGDPNLKNRPNNPEAKAAWYARHAKSLKANPHFRAYARATWAEGGLVGYADGTADAGSAGDFAEQRTMEEAPVETPTPAVVEAPPSTKLTGLLEEVADLRYKPQDEYEDKLEELQSKAEGLTSGERAKYANALSGIQTDRRTLEDTMRRSAENVKEATEGPFRKARGPLAALRAGVAEAEKYGDRYGEYLQYRNKALEQLGGEIPFTGKETEAQRQNILERNRFRREAADKVGAEMMLAFAPRAAPTATAAEREAEAPAGEPVRPAPQPAQTGAVEPVGAVIPATPELATAPTAGQPSPIEKSLQAQIDTREAAMRTAAAAAKGQAQGTATGITRALADLKKVAPDGTEVPLDLSLPADRYSPQVKAVVSQMGDYALVKGAMTAVGYSAEEAERIAVDEVLRGSGRAGLGVMPTGLEAMEIARESPEYQQAAQAAATRAQIALEDAKLKAKEAAIVNQIRTAQVDLDLKLAQDYQIKKRALEQQTTELRRQINNATIQPKGLFVKGENFAMSAVVAALDLIGSGLGAKSSVMDFVQQRITADLNAQVGMIDRGRTILGDLVKQGNDIDSSYKLADAFYKKVYALEIEKATSSLQSDRARLAGFDAAQKLLADAAKTEEEILKKTTDTIRDFYQNKLTSAATGVRNAAEYARIKAPVKAAGIRAAAASKKEEAKKKLDEWKMSGPPELATFWEGKTTDDKGYAALSKWAMATNNEAALKSTGRPVELVMETRTLPDKSVITLPTFKQMAGRHILAYSETDKKEYTSIMADAKKFVDALNDLEEIAAKHNFTGFSGWTGKDAKADEARAKKLEGDLASYLGGKFAYNVGVPQEAEYQRLKDAIPKASEFSTASYSKAAFGQFRNDLLRQIQNIAADRLVGGTSLMLTPPRPARTR